MKTDLLNNSPLSAFATSLFTAFFIFILEIIFVLAFTALMYSGELSSQIPRALGFIILGDAIFCGIAAYFSSNPGAIGVEQDAPGAMLAVITASIIATLSGAATKQFATVALMIVSTTLLTGVLLLVLGYFKLGGIVRFLPYPVIGGFLAGSGWLLVQGGIGVMADIPMGLSWFKAHTLMLWLPGVLLGIMSRIVSQKVKKPYTIPLLMLGASLLFYALVWMRHLSLMELRAAGWLLDSYASTSRWEFPLAPSFISQVDWSVLLTHLPAMIPIAMISAIGLLLNSSGMELLIKKDIDLNRELMVAGFGNLFAGLAGGLAGFQDISFSTLNQVMSGGKRLVGILTAVMIAATLFVGTSAILYIPKFVFGSVLIYLGIELLMDWVYEAWFKFSRIDFLVVVTILVILAVSGVLQGIIAGLILAVVMFAVSYSRINVIKFAFTGREFRSRVTRAPHEGQVLDTHGDQLYIMKLEGFIFFGTANGIFDTLRQRIKTAKNIEVKYCLLDFTKVSGIDSTGMLSFNRMIQWSHEQGITLVFSGLGQKEQEHFLQENTEHKDALQFLPNMDRALEWCENEIISVHLADLRINKDIADQLRAILKDEGIEKLIPYLQRREYRAGEYLIREGDTPDFIFFIHSGQVTAQLESPNGETIRLETMRSGRSVGEIAFYLGTRRTASVTADQDSVVYSLSIDELKDMEANNPEIANIFHRISVLLLSERVMHLTRTVRALERS
ncbi:MAG: SulP family inorganic anion transporter [Chloroflexota bacterium]